MSAYKPTRTFSANEGDYSVDKAGPDAIERDIDELMAMFDPNATHSDGSPGGISPENFDFDLMDPSMLSNIGGKLDGNPMNAQTIVDQLLTMVKDRYTKSESDANLTNKTNPLIKTLSYDPNTGILKATTEAGAETQVFDLNVEKIPAKIAIVEENNRILIRITNDDGTYTQSDVTDLLQQYNFVEEDIIYPVVTKKNDTTTVSFRIKDASIGIAQFKSEVLEIINSSTSSAAASAQSALESKLSAEKSASDAESAKNAAMQSANAAGISADNANAFKEDAEKNAKAAGEYAKQVENAVTDADTYAKLSKSYAVGDTGVRPGENQDNAKWYYEHAKAAVSGDGVSVFVQQEEPSVTNCIWIKPIGGASEIEDVVLNLSDNEDGTIFAEIDGNLKSIDNAVTSESELSTGKYCFDIL